MGAVLQILDAVRSMSVMLGFVLIAGSSCATMVATVAQVNEYFNIIPVMVTTLHAVTKVPMYVNATHHVELLLLNVTITLLVPS